MLANLIAPETVTAERKPSNDPKSRGTRLSHGPDTGRNFREQFISRVWIIGLVVVGLVTLCDFIALIVVLFAKK
jgi:hypothetical protein